MAGNFKNNFTLQITYVADKQGIKITDDIHNWLKLQEVPIIMLSSGK